MAKMQFSLLAALVACQSLALRPELARASMSRQIASVGSLLASVSSGSSSLAALEAATDIVNNLLVETGNATDHITDADEQLLEDIIALVENTIYDSMEHSHEADKTSLADAVDAFTSCNDDIADSQSETGELGRLRAGAMDAQKELDRLRELVDDWTDTNTTFWDAFDTHMRFIPNPPECPEFPQKTMPALDLYFEESEYSRWYATHQGAYHASRNAFTEADSALSDAIGKYDIQLAVRDAKYCDWKSVLETACIHFDACSSGAADHFSDLSVRVAHDEKQRIEAYTAGQTLIHQIRFLLAQVPDQTTPPIDTSAWTIAFPVLPEKGLCDEDPLEDDMWVPKPSCEAAASIFWQIGRDIDPAQTCDQVCEQHTTTCSQSALDDLNGKSLEYFSEKFALAGYQCNSGSPLSHCERDDNCVRWGSPYIHANHFVSGHCQGGSVPSVAPCGGRPVDHNHRRLCPCVVTLEGSD